MSLLCKVFGHKPLTHAWWKGNVGYADAIIDTVDGIGTRHLFLTAECPRCGSRYSICNVHVPRKEQSK